MIFETISAELFKQEMQNPDAIVIDVRTPEEYEKYGVLPNVDYYMNMYDNDFYDNLWELDKNKKYLIYCWHANRTALLLQYMESVDFKYVKDLAWGIDWWVKWWFELIEKKV